MLLNLAISNVVLIEKLSLGFERGLCALTGETGAGKSILLDSLGLALGMRAEARLVRKGADKAQVSASFDVPSSHPVYSLLGEADIAIDAGEPLVLRRVLEADGRSKAYINDQPVSVSLLRGAGALLVEIHGQFETQGLLDPSAHLWLLDLYARIDVAARVGALWQDWQQTRSAFEALKERAGRAREQEAYLRASVADLDALDPKTGEEAELDTLRSALMNREQILSALNHAYQALDGEERDPVRAAMGALDRVLDKLGGRGDAIMEALERASAEIQECVSLMSVLSSDFEHSEHSLETIDDRLFALRAQARKHSCDVDDLPAKREELAAQLNMIEDGESALSAAALAVEKARSDYVAAAREISAERKSAAARLDQLVQAELPPLKLEKARFVTKIEELSESEWGPSGMDRVRFLVATNPGADPGPLAKIASGGEMARFMLALKVVMAGTGDALSLIFDEVDAGVGGAVADAVGERLAALSKQAQVLVVTHAPQIAARARSHMIVRKGGDDKVLTEVVPLNDPVQRREEIARMLSGAQITEEARAQASRLMEQAA